MVCCQLILWGEASSSLLPGIIPAGYVSQTGYQYDSISRVAGQRELAPPSKFSKLGGFISNVFITSGILHPQTSHNKIVRPKSLVPADRQTAKWEGRASARTGAPHLHLYSTRLRSIASNLSANRCYQAANDNLKHWTAFTGIGLRVNGKRPLLRL